MPLKVRGTQERSEWGKILVYRQIFRMNFSSLVRDASCFEHIPLLLDVRLVVNTFESLSEFGESPLDPGKPRVKVCHLEAPLLTAYITLTPVVEIQIHARNSVFVEVDSIDAPHEHEADASLFAELVHKRLPIGLHPLIGLATLYCCALPDVFAGCAISLSSRLSCINWRSSSAAGSCVTLACCLAGIRDSSSRATVAFSKTT